MFNQDYVQAEGDFYCTYCANSHPLGKCPLLGICKFCKKRTAILHFGDMLSITHGGEMNCCQICAVQQQLDHAIERADAIPDLVDQLDRLMAEEHGD